MIDRELQAARKNMARLELLLIALFNLAMFYLFIQVDMLEQLYHYASAHESFELDEIVPMSFTLAITLGIFAFRRWREEKRMQQMLIDIASRDPLTTLFNRRRFQEALKDEFARVNRGGGPFSLLMIDIDNFKSINDNFGHSTGDEVLKQFSDLIRSSTRAVDRISRWGGEEFLILSPETPAEGARCVATKLGNLIREFEFEGIGHCTASIGVASLRSDDSDDSIINRADHCLYLAKHSGKDKFICAEQAAIATIVDHSEFRKEAVTT